MQFIRGIATRIGSFTNPRPETDMQRPDRDQIDSEKHHESNLVWGPFSMFASMVITVIGSMKHDLRWLLLLAWPFWVLPMWKISQHLRFRNSRYLTSIGLSLIGAIGLYALASWLKPPDITNDGLPSEAFSGELRSNYPLGYELVTVDLNRATTHTNWSPNADFGTMPIAGDFIWTYAGNVSWVKDEISIGLPSFLTRGGITFLGNSASLRLFPGITEEILLGADTPLVRGQTFESTSSDGRVVLSKSPKFSVTVRIIAFTKAGTVLLIGLKPIR